MQWVRIPVRSLCQVLSLQCYRRESERAVQVSNRSSFFSTHPNPPAAPPSPHSSQHLHIKVADIYMNGRDLTLNTEREEKGDLIELLEIHLHECFHAGWDAVLSPAELQGFFLPLNERLLFALKQLIFLTVVTTRYQTGRKCISADWWMIVGLISIRITGMLQGNEGWWLIIRCWFSDKKPHLNSRRDAPCLLGVLSSEEVILHLFRTWQSGEEAKRDAPTLWMSCCILLIHTKTSYTL